MKGKGIEEDVEAPQSGKAVKNSAAIFKNPEKGLAAGSKTSAEKSDKGSSSLHFSGEKEISKLRSEMITLGISTASLEETLSLLNQFKTKETAMNFLGEVSMLSDSLPADKIGELLRSKDPAKALAMIGEEKEKKKHKPKSKAAARDDKREEKEQKREKTISEKLMEAKLAAEQADNAFEPKSESDEEEEEAVVKKTVGRSRESGYLSELRATEAP